MTTITALLSAEPASAPDPIGAWTTLEWTRAYPETHNQGAWCLRTRLSPCGTIACFAGWRVLLAGYVITINPDGLDRDLRMVRTPDGLVTVADLAAELLGIDWRTADRVFFSGMNRLAHVVEDVFGPRLPDLPELPGLADLDLPGLGWLE